MSKLIFTLICVLSLGMGGKSIPKDPVDDPVILPPTEIPEGRVIVTTKITAKPEDYRRVEKLNSTTPMVEKVLNSPELKESIMKAWWNGKPGFQDSQDTPEEVYSKMIEGHRWVQEYGLKYNRTPFVGCSVLGWTDASTNTVWFNTCNFDGRDFCGIVGTRGHEQMHKLGYVHKNSKRNLSVPYYVGTQFSLICQKFSK